MSNEKQAKNYFKGCLKRYKNKKVVVSFNPTSQRPFKPGPLIYGTLEPKSECSAWLLSEKGKTYIVSWRDVEFITEDKRP